MSRFMLPGLLLLVGVAVVWAQGEQHNKLTEEEKQAGWKLIFDGKSLDGWTPSKENPTNFKVENGVLVAAGNRAHLFYGPENYEGFRNFEFQAEVRTIGRSNSGIFFCTKYQPKDWPSVGFEAQIANSFPDNNKTGSIWGFVQVNPSPVKDDEWFHYYIKVQGDQVTIRINDKTVVDWTQPADWPEKTKRLGKGTIALQAHDANSRTEFRNIKLRILD